MRSVGAPPESPVRPLRGSPSRLCWPRVEVGRIWPNDIGRLCGARGRSLRYMPGFTVVGPHPDPREATPGRRQRPSPGVRRDDPRHTHTSARRTASEARPPEGRPASTPPARAPAETPRLGPRQKSGARCMGARPRYASRAPLSWQHSAEVSPLRRRGTQRRAARSASGKPGPADSGGAVESRKGAMGDRGCGNSGKPEPARVGGNRQEGRGDRREQRQEHE